MEIDGKPIGRIVIGLFGGIVPKTVKNFKTLAEGNGKELSLFNKIIRNVLIEVCTDCL